MEPIEEDPWAGLQLDDGETVTVADGYDDAIIGTAEVHGTLVAVYDIGKCIDILMLDDKMSYEEAVEYFEYNTLGAYIGDQTPIFVNMKAPHE